MTSDKAKDLAAEIADYCFAPVHGTEYVEKIVTLGVGGRNLGSWRKDIFREHIAAILAKHAEPPASDKQQSADAARGEMFTDLRVGDVVVVRVGGIGGTERECQVNRSPWLYCSQWVLGVNEDANWVSLSRVVRVVRRAGDAKPAEPEPEPAKANDAQQAIADECEAIKAMLLAKNAAYGNSALEPIRLFSSCDAGEQLRVRIDDKLSRLARGSAAGEDVALDLIGYLVLLRIAERAIEREKGSVE